MKLMFVLVAVSLPHLLEARSVFGSFFSDPFEIFSPGYSFFVSVKAEPDLKLLEGRYLLKHHSRDGLEDVLETYGMDEDQIEALRNATVITTISTQTNDDDELEIKVASSSGSEYTDTTTFVPEREYNITNPINGELTAFKALVMSSNTLQTISEGLDSGNFEIKTWTFLPEGIRLETEVTKKNQLFPVVASQIMVRVDEDDNPKPLQLGWFR